MCMLSVNIIKYIYKKSNNNIYIIFLCIYSEYCKQKYIFMNIWKENNNNNNTICEYIYI